MMKPFDRLTVTVLTASTCCMLFFSSCSSATAQRIRRGHRHVSPVTVVVKSPLRIETSSAAQPRDNRLSLVLDYLKRKSHISPKKYARLTGLSTQRALSELQHFASDPKIPIVRRAKSGKPIFSLKR